MIQNHVTSLELSLKLKELGVPQRSSFWWIVTAEEPLLVFKTDVGSYLENGGAVNHSYLEPRSICSAFLSSELGEMLKGHHQHLPTRYSDGMWKKHAIWTKDNGEKLVQAENEVNARAKMLIYLIENKLIQVESL